MKKTLFISAILSIVSLTDIAAQHASISKVIENNFESTFSGATNIRWEYCSKDVFLAKFNYLEKTWLAYFDRQGNLVSSGRKVKNAELPVAVQNGIVRMKEKAERKHGPLTAGVIYEMKTSNLTEFMVPLQNSEVYLLVAFKTDGSGMIRKKRNLKSEQKPAKDVLASRK